MGDIEALRLLTKEIQNIKTLPNPPPSHDGIEKFEKTTTQVIDRALGTTQEVNRYGEAINGKMEEMRSALEQSTTKIQELLKKTLDSIKVGTNGKLPGKTMDYVMRLQKLEVKKQRLEESILKTQEIMDKIQQGMAVTIGDIELLRGCICSWVEEKEESYQEEQNRLEEERRQQEEEARKLKEEEESKRREEEERKRKEEEERRKKEEEERLKREEEERQRKEEERKKREEVERKRREEEERRKREAKEREEEERRRKDPANWTPYTYRRQDGELDAFHRGICCQISGMTGTLQEEDFECFASDEWREEDGLNLAVGEKLASSLIHVQVKENEKDLKVPLRVYVPHCSISDSSDEVVVKASIDGGVWTDQHPVSVPASQTSQSGLNYAGIDVSNFHTVKLLAVAKTRSQELVVDKGGINQASTVDKNIRLFVPRDTFSKPKKMKLEIRQIRENSLAFAVQYYDHCHNVLSTSSVMTITCEAQTDKDIELDLTKNALNDKRTIDKGRYLHVYKCRGDNWKIADSEIKGRNMDVSITLPSRKDSFIVMEIEGRLGIPTEEFLKAADELYFHSNASIVRIIAKQRADNPYIIMIQCVRRDQVSSRVSELERLGYSLGPDTSKEFALTDGQSIIVGCSGNIALTTESEVKLTFHAYMDTSKEEVSLHAVDEYKQKDLDVYLGQLYFEVLKDDRDGALYTKTKGSLPITLPKRARERPRTARARIRFPYYLTTLAKFLAMRLTTQAKDDTWLQVIYSLGSRRDMDNIRRRAATRCETPNNECQICEIILQDWMKSKPVQEDKVKPILWALQDCQKMPLSDECEKFVHIHMNYLSDPCMSEMAKKIEDDWTLLATNLGLSNEDITACKNGSEGSNVEAAFMMLCKWRVSEAAINSGLEVLNDLLGTLETTQNNMGLKEYIRHVLKQMIKE